MEKIREWAVLLLFLSAGSLIYCHLLPSGNISKTVKSFVSVISLSLVLMPLFGIKDFFGTPFFIPENQAETVTVYDYIKQSAEAEINRLLDGEIKKYTYVPYKTEINIDINDDGSINIEYVGIIFSAEPDRKKEMRKALKEILQTEPHIKVEKTGE